LVKERAASRTPKAYGASVNFPGHMSLAQGPKRVRWFMAVAWALIAVKCVVVWWAMIHWSVATHPLWVVGPTLVFAALVTAIWLTHHSE
jgi:hypothetical protein